MTELLRSIFPNTESMLISVFWVITSMIASVLFNNQDLSNKKNNAWKSFLILFFAFSWAMTNTYYDSGVWYPGYVAFAIVVWVLFLLGDWIAYWSHQLKFSPGGLPGWVWFSVVRFSKTLQAKATVRAVASLRPTERKLHEAAVAEKNAKLLKALVESVPGAKIIVAPEPITAAFPNIKQLTVTPSYIINVVPETLLVTVQDPLIDSTPAVSPASEMSASPHTEP